MERPPEITNKLREMRFKAGQMTQQQLADSAGVTRQTIIALEADRYAPSLLLAFKLAAVFGVGVEELFSYAKK